MTKISKKLTLIVLAVLCIVACVGVLVACNDDTKPTGVEYTVTVLNPDNTAASDVSVTVKKSGAILGTPVKTNAEGKVTFTLAEDDGYTVTLSTLPAHCEVAEGTNLALSKDGLTVKLAEEYHYTIKLFNEDNEPFVAEGVFVAICTMTAQGGTGVCLPPVAVGNDGVAKIYAAKGNYKIKVEGLGEDYYFNSDKDGYLDGGYFSDTDTSKTPTQEIVIFHVSEETNNVVEVKEQLAQFPDQDGKVLVGVDYTASLVYNETDKSYHIGTANGPQVVVLLTKADTERFGLGGALAYFELVNVNAKVANYVFDATPEGSPSYVKVTNDYRTFLRGFVNYQQTPSMQGYTLSIPKDIDTETYYTKYVNKDGVYPLTQELKDFLEVFCKDEYNAYNIKVQLGSTDVKPANYWLFPCYYYADGGSIDPVEKDAIVGEYNLVSITEGDNTMAVGDEYVGENSIIVNVFQALADGKDGVKSIITDDIAVFCIEANGSFNILLADGEPYDFGTWSNNNGTYTFNCDYCTITYSNGTLTVVDGDTTMVFAANA